MTSFNAIPETWTNQWVNDQLNNFNIRGEPEWDKCDICFVPTHIHVAKWILIDNNTKLVCKKCQQLINNK